MSSPNADFDPQFYWRGLVAASKGNELDEVGHPDMGRRFNELAYRLRLAAVKQAVYNLPRVMLEKGIFEGAFGVGFYMAFWRSLKLPRVAGVELSATACSHVQQRFPSFNLRNDDLSKIHLWSDWPSLQGTFGLVTGIDVIYHIIDPEMARGAVGNLAALVAQGGVLMVTDKFPSLNQPFLENKHVVRRPLSWYVSWLSEAGMKLRSVSPVFWCMDPPSHQMGQAVSASVAHCAWAAMRACIKYWPRNSRVQSVFGSVVGKTGLLVDSLIVPRMSHTPNLELAVFEREKN